jgi:hypothetical protein
MTVNEADIRQMVDTAQDITPYGHDIGVLSRRNATDVCVLTERKSRIQCRRP